MPRRCAPVGRLAEAATAGSAAAAPAAASPGAAGSGTLVLQPHDQVLLVQLLHQPACPIWPQYLHVSRTLDVNVCILVDPGIEYHLCSLAGINQMVQTSCVPCESSIKRRSRPSSHRTFASCVQVCASRATMSTGAAAAAWSDAPSEAARRSRSATTSCTIYVSQDYVLDAETKTDNCHLKQRRLQYHPRGNVQHD